MTMALKSNIRAILDRQGVSPYKLAQIWGKHSNHVYTLVKQPTLDTKHLATMVELAEILNVRVEDLYEVEK